MQAELQGVLVSRAYGTVSFFEKPKITYGVREDVFLNRCSKFKPYGLAEYVSVYRAEMLTTLPNA